MKLTEALSLLSEGKGREVYTSREGAKRKVTKSRKGRVKTYPSIKKALSQGSFGQIFSTTAANRLYVISKGKWGAKSGRGKSIKKHAARTLVRYGKGSDKLAKKYGSRSMRKARGIFGKDGRKDKKD